MGCEDSIKLNVVGRNSSLHGWSRLKQPEGKGPDPSRCVRDAECWKKNRDGSKRGQKRFSQRGCGPARVEHCGTATLISTASGDRTRSTDTAGTRDNAWTTVDVSIDSTTSAEHRNQQTLAEQYTIAHDFARQQQNHSHPKLHMKHKCGWITVSPPRSSPKPGTLHTVLDGESAAVETLAVQDKGPTEYPSKSVCQAISWWR